MRACLHPPPSIQLILGSLKIQRTEQRFKHPSPPLHTLMTLAFSYTPAVPSPTVRGKSGEHRREPTAGLEKPQQARRPNNPIPPPDSASKAPCDSKMVDDTLVTTQEQQKSEGMNPVGGRNGGGPGEEREHELAQVSEERRGSELTGACTAEISLSRGENRVDDSVGNNGALPETNEIGLTRFGTGGALGGDVGRSDAIARGQKTMEMEDRPGERLLELYLFSFLNTVDIQVL